MALSTTGDTWGIDGPAFLLAYLVIAAAVGVAGFRARRAIADPAGSRPLDLATHPHDVAYLNGGAELAVYSALSAMHVRGTIRTGEGRVQAVAAPERDDDALEQAIRATASAPVQGRRLRFHRPVGAALAEIETRLVTAGLLLGPEQRRRYRAVGWWMLAVAGLGLVRLLAGIAGARPVGYLFAALAVVTAVAVTWLVRVPRLSRRGQRELARLREEHHSLAPAMTPDWRVYGPGAAALGVGIFGVGALWASDPAFADGIAAQRLAPGAAAGYSGGSGCGSSGSGDGGGGGGGGCGGGGCGG